jgi:hypothetical protein
MMGEIATKKLTKPEAARLATCEKAIERGINTFVEVGQALTEIRDAKLYRASHKTFEAYCKDRWEISRPRAYELIDHAKVASADPVLSDVSDKLTARDIRAIKGDIPAAAAEIKSRVEQGETPEKAAADVVAEARAEKQTRGKNPDVEISDDEWKRQQEEMRAGFSPELKAAQDATEAAKTANKAKPESGDERIDDLERAVIELENENAKLKEELKKFEAMRLEYERGGFAEVIASLGEQIRVLKTRVSAESREKVKNLNAMEFWKKEAIKLGYSRDTVLSLDEPANG